MKTKPSFHSYKRRDFIQLSLATAIAGVASYNKPAFAQSTDTKIILLGTQGGPNYNLLRGEGASVVVVDNQPYLIDCGYGTLRALTVAGVPFLDIAQVFLSHLHDDHSADIAAFIGHQWTQGRIDPTTIFGPYGTDRLIEAANLYNQANTDIRIIDEARSVLPEEIFSGSVLPATQIPHLVFEDSRVSVHSIENTHFPAKAKQAMPYRSLSYRLDSADRSIVFSGDTTYSENLVTLAQGADVLVCEVIELTSTRSAFDVMVANGNYADNPEGVWDHIKETHASTEEVGRMANEAGVELLVLNHILPGALQDVADDVYLEGIRRNFQGQVIIGADQLVL
jgi:ribonuclease BN (tRNA processing enzyme)